MNSADRHSLIQNSPRAPGGDEPQPRYVFCLSIDLVGSTKLGLSLTSQQLDRFNFALIRHIQPHLAALDLGDAVVKFTGDGWLVMAVPEKTPNLCCLALIFTRSFQTDLASLSGLSRERMPAVRAAICSGRDCEIVLPGGQRDFVGDSVRRAVRASTLCEHNEILVSASVLEWADRDFAINRDNLAPSRLKPGVKWEENFAIHILHRLKTDAVSQADAPSVFVHTLQAIGQREEAVAAVIEMAVRPKIEEWAPGTSPATDKPASPIPASQRKALLSQEWNRVLHSLDDYAAVAQVFEAMKSRRLPRDVATYSILANKSPDYATARYWIDAMRADGIAPNVVTYNSLITHAPDFAAARGLLDEMRGDGIAPDVVTYTSLITHTPDFAAARGLLDEMRGDGEKYKQAF